VVKNYWRKDMFKVGVLGAAGYSGLELLKLLKNHPAVEITCITSDTYKGKRLDEVYPEFLKTMDLVFEEPIPDRIINKFEVVFLALHAKKSAEMAEKFVQMGKIVIDLSGAFRLQDKDLYPQWYDFEHPTAGLLKQAAYGLPELFRHEISSSRFISNPGCYATSILLGLAPLLEKKIIDVSGIIVDSKSGISGKGRTPDVTSLFCELNENCYAYKIGKHQHVPEMEQAANRLTGAKDCKILFVPHLIPINRGILSNIYCKLEKNIKFEDIVKQFKEFYKTEQFVRILEPGKSPQIKAVAYTNYCDIGLTLWDKTLVITTVIDNLLKGAAGQAVQNFNIITAQAEETGLPL
jgi:N-acetyl-gamma-glutamyl-phosphate reductase